MGREPNNLEMILLRQKAGQQLKDSTKVIEFPQNKSFMEQVEAMKKSGDIVDVDDINISEKITDRDMFNNSFLNKPTIEGQMEKITGASNKIKQIQKEQADMYKPKSDAEIKAKFDKQNKEAVERLKNKRMLDEDEIAQLDEDIGGLEYTNDFDGTLASANKLRKERAEYIRDMEMEYKKGNLDPGPGEANRERFLQKKFDEMEASGDKKLMTRDEIEELSAFENTPPVRTTPFDEAVEYNAKPEDVVQNLVDQKFGVGYFDNVGSTPAQRGSAREFLVEALKKENPNETNFSDIVDAVDVKAITQGGGGAAGDPIALVNKYFGPRIAEMIPSGASSEEIAIFTERVLTKVRDASGLKPGDPRFDRMTARFVEDFARGGLAKILEV